MNTITQLKEIMKTEVDLLAALIQALESQRQAVIYYNIDELEAIGDRQIELLKPIGALEVERLKTVSALAEEYDMQKDGDKSGELRLTEILDIIPSAERDYLKKLGERLRESVKQVAQINEENDKLIEQTQRFIQNNVRLLSENYSRQLVDQKM